MRRIQIHIDEVLDDAVEREASRRGVSKAAVIRSAVAKEMNVPAEPSAVDPWEDLAGWLDDEPVDDIDEVVYGRP